MHFLELKKNSGSFLSFTVITTYEPCTQISYMFVVGKYERYIRIVSDSKCHSYLKVWHIIDNIGSDKLIKKKRKLQLIKQAIRKDIT